MKVSPISGLGYIVLRTSEMTAWKSYATDVLGLMPAKLALPEGSHAYRMDDRMARVILEPSDQNGVAATGWDVGGEAAWDDLRQRFEKAGVNGDHVTGDEAEQRGSVELFRVVDPAGEVVEFAHKPIVDPIDHFVSPRGVRFVTGDQGMGHITRAVANYDDTLVFYRDILGMQVRETQANKAIRSTYLSPNPRQHSVALIDIRARGTNLFHHFLLEVDSMDDLGRTLDLARKGDQLRVDLGKHFNDLMTSFYMASPSGLQIEYGYGGLRVDPETWIERRQGGVGGASLWGHNPVEIKAPSEAEAIRSPGRQPAHV